MSAKGWNKMATMHKRSQFQVAYCYRMVFYTVTAMILKVPPVHLMVIERANIYSRQNKYEVRSKLISSWQQKWDHCFDGRWTHRLIGDITRWVLRWFGEVTFHTNQILTGQGCFAAYLHIFHIQESKTVVFNVVYLLTMLNIVLSIATPGNSG